MPTCTTTLCLYLLFLCAPVAANASDAVAEAADKVATDSAGNQDEASAKHEDILDRALSPLDNAVSEINRQDEASAKHEDILDRAFSPLDNAVSDINRDLNKGDGSATPESNE